MVHIQSAFPAAIVVLCISAWHDTVVNAQPQSLLSPLAKVLTEQTVPIPNPFSLRTAAINPLAGDAQLPGGSLFNVPKNMLRDWKTALKQTTAAEVDEALNSLAQENFNKWNDALKSKDYEKVASLYSTTDLTFLPTVSAEFVRDGPTTKEYFMEFLKKHPVGTVTSDEVQSYGPSAYLHSGMYTFMIGPENERKAVDARFSFMWRKIGDAWKIVHHHSSALPKVAGEEDQKARDEAMYPIAQANFKRWNDALESKDYEKVASLYSSTDLSFLPTVSADFIQSTPEAEAYFVEFLKKLPSGTITADKVQSFSDEAYLHSGMYTFLVGPAEDRKPVQARFSYVWRKIAGDWKIVHHHSSALPK